MAFGDDNAQCETFPKSDQIEHSVRVDELPVSLFVVVMGSERNEEGTFSLSMECSAGGSLRSPRTVKGGVAFSAFFLTSVLQSRMISCW